MDVRDENSVRETVEATVRKFGGIDIVVNNASALSPTKTEATMMKNYDLMHSVNTRGTFLLYVYLSLQRFSLKFADQSIVFRIFDAQSMRTF